MFTDIAGYRGQSVSGTSIPETVLGPRGNGKASNSTAQAPKRRRHLELVDYKASAQQPNKVSSMK